MSDELKLQLEQVREQMRGKNRNNPIEAAEFEELRRQEETLINQITRTQEQAQKVEEAKQVTSVTIGGEVIEVPPEIAEFVGLAVSETLAEAYKEHNEEIKAAEERELQLKRQLSELQKNHADITANHDTLQKQYNQAVLDKTDAEQKRDNAVSQLQQKEAELQKAQETIEQLQQQIEVNKPKTDIEIPSTERAKELIESIKKRYVKATPIGAGNFIEAVDEDGNKEIVHKSEIGPLDLPDLGQLAVLPRQDNQTDHTTADMADTEANAIPSTSEVSQFQAEQSGTDNHCGSDVEPAADGTIEKTLEARVAELEARVNKLEGAT